MQERRENSLRVDVLLAILARERANGNLRSSRDKQRSQEACSHFLHAVNEKRRQEEHPRIQSIKVTLRDRRNISVVPYPSSCSGISKKGVVRDTSNLDVGPIAQRHFEASGGELFRFFFSFRL